MERGSDKIESLMELKQKINALRIRDYDRDDLFDMIINLIDEYGDHLRAELMRILDSDEPKRELNRILRETTRSEGEFDLWRGLYEDIDWFTENYLDVARKYGGKFVAVRDKRVLMSSPSLADLFERLDEADVDRRFLLIKYVPLLRENATELKRISLEPRRPASRSKEG